MLRIKNAYLFYRLDNTFVMNNGISRQFIQISPFTSRVEKLKGLKNSSEISGRLRGDNARDRKR